jgi:apolipoprotein N-acyltransferase
LANKGRWYLWPLLFSGIELVRGFGQMSFPWLHIGYDFGQILPLLQPVAYTGVYGLGFLLALSASLVAVVWEGKISRRWLLAPAGFWAAWLGLGFWALATPTPAGGMRVAVIQPAVPQTRKWEESYFQTVIDKALHTADRLPKVPYDLIVFPETAIPDYWSWRLLEAARFQRLADSSGATVVLGALEGIADPSLPAGGRMYNSAFVLRPWSHPQRYDKLRLVPFSEHLPFENVFPVLNYVQLGQSSFSAGDSLPVINSVVPWSPSICYEMVYPDFARLSWHHGSHLLVNLTNDGWFGRSAGPYQHWNIQRFRAIEAGMPLIRSANTGISGVVDAQGRELAISTLMTDTVLVATVPAGHGSFAGRFGGWIELFLGLGGVLALGVAGKPRAKVPESVT